MSSSSSLINNSLSSGWEKAGLPSGITNVLERRLVVVTAGSSDIVSPSLLLAVVNVTLLIDRKGYYLLHWNVLKWSIDISLSLGRSLEYSRI